MLVSVLSSLLLAAAVSAVNDTDIVRYDGHKVIRLEPYTQDQLMWLIDLHDNEELDFWTHPSFVRPVDIRLSPSQFNELQRHPHWHQMNVTILHDDVQKLIEDLGQHPHSKRQLSLSPIAITDEFPTYDTIYKWLLKLKNENSKLVTVTSIGLTYERRETYLIKISIPVLGKVKPAVWIDGGIHAREWIAVSTVVNLIDKMVTGYRNQDSEVMGLLNACDWYFLPVANPDGYVYSHKQGARLWRKTRTPYLNGIGADPNRNFDYYWGTTGISKLPSSDSYCGPYAWSEKCTVNLKNALEGLRNELKFFMTLHSYGQMWFLPYAYSKSAYPFDYRTTYYVATAGATAMRKVTGVNFRVGRVPDLLYEASGSSMDWVKAVLKTPFAYGMELRPVQGTQNGFIASTQSIKPSATEVWAGIKDAVKLANYYNFYSPTVIG